MEANGLLEKDELEHIRKIFNKFNLKGDGTITFDVYLW
jgi:Ca2+-binding EF-hand superfamily protein